MRKAGRTVKATVVVTLDNLIALVEELANTSERIDGYYYDFDTQILLNKHGFTLKDGHDCEVETFSTLEEAHAFIVNLLEEVNAEEIFLNDEYNAKITSKGVTVGCQFFDYDAFDNLAQAVAKVRK